MKNTYISREFKAIDDAVKINLEYPCSLRLKHIQFILRTVDMVFVFKSGFKKSIPDIKLAV